MVSHSYTYAYGDLNSLEVVEAPAAPLPPEEKGIPMEYVYAGVAIVLIVMVVAAGYMLMKKRKK